MNHVKLFEEFTPKWDFDGADQGYYIKFEESLKRLKKNMPEYFAGDQIKSEAYDAIVSIGSKYGWSKDMVMAMINKHNG